MSDEKSATPEELQKKFEELYGEPPAPAYKNNVPWLKRKIAEKEANSEIPAEDTVDVPASPAKEETVKEADTSPIEPEETVPAEETAPVAVPAETPAKEVEKKAAPKTPAKPKAASNKAVKGSTAIVTMNGEYVRTYSKDIHGDKFIDYAAEFCSKVEGREFTVE